MHLEKFTTRNSPVSDITVLKNLRNLKELNLTGCKNIRKIDVVRNFKKLEIIRLNGTKVDDLGPVLHLKNMKKIAIGLSFGDIATD